VVDNIAIDYYWQTCGWSGSYVSPRACLYQRVIDQALCGIQVDINDVVRDPGAWQLKEAEQVDQLPFDKAAALIVAEYLGETYKLHTDPKVEQAAHFAANALREAVGLPKEAP
jgi:hypothetical protein